ncbi:MAG: M67 family metallopeptidase [Chloroflexota bacterium]
MEKAKGEKKVQREQDVVRLPGSYLREIVDHAREGKPNEVCGLIAARDGYPVKLYRTTNNDPSPRVRYNVEPRELLEIHGEIEDNGWSLLAIYHSHPMSEAYPSGTDVSLSYYPDAIYLICSLADDDDPVVRAFRIVGKQVAELGLEIDDEVGEPQGAP